MSGLGWVLLVVGVLLASAPFVGERLFLGLPLFKQAKSGYWRVVEFALAYGVFIWLGRLIEANVSQNKSQDWAFYATTFLLFVVAGFPAFIWRYLWRKN